LRRAYLSGDGPDIRGMFEREHPELKFDARFNTRFDYNWWDICHHKEEEWLVRKLGISYHDVGMGNAPAWFRRDLNRTQRAKEKAVLHRAFLRDEWDDFQLPRYRHNVNWNWW